MSEQPKRLSEKRKQMLEIAKRRREAIESGNAAVFPSGKLMAEAVEQKEPQPEKRRGVRVYAYGEQIAFRVPLAIKVAWVKFVRRFEVPGGQAGMGEIVGEFFKQHPVCLAKILHWHVQDERTKRKAKSSKQSKREAA